ncbi:MAG TPA: serine--tRNA ligase [Planctomycetes bacterium]|nr:serine--tRNA ligase [Planctomycetota bacterium]HIL37673.1 serine--tRNA ligase [Planctomycetota bacterium]
MLDLKFIRQNPDLVRAGAIKKHISCEIDRILELDAVHRELGVNVDQLRQRQKQAGGKIAQASPEERGQMVAEQKEHKAELKALEERQQGLTGELQELLLRVPMPPAADVPEGKDDEENTEVRRWGQPRSFEFEARSHQDLGEMHGWIDVERGARLAGSRNYLLKGDLVLLESAVMRLALDQMVERGFTPVTVPTLVRTEAMRGTGYFPGGEDQAYRCDERDDLWLVGTAEVPLTAMHAGEILDGAQLPLKFVAHSSCYRREAGTYGKDTRGLYRVHQFQKVEQVIIDVADEERSLEHHAAILDNAETLMQSLDLPYRVVNVCGGDLGQGQVQKFDIETWMPSREGFGETHSASRFHDFQSRRLDLRYRGEDGKVEHCHTLNNTVAASTRMLIALMENHQNEDGSVNVPEPLRPYMGDRSVIGEPGLG